MLLLPAVLLSSVFVIKCVRWPFVRCRVSVRSEDLGSTSEFLAVLSTPAVAVDSAAVSAACGGDGTWAEAVTVYLHSR